MLHQPQALVAPLIGGLLVTAALAGCSDVGVRTITATPPGPTSASPAAPADPSPTASTPPTAQATPTESATPTPAPVPTSPLTGLPQEAPQPVLVVKLDNTHNAQPHAGLSKADLVYIEEVEYSMTRIAAVFSGQFPDRIGPVRSARITDIDLLSQFGEPAFAYSGAQHKMFPVIDGAPLQDVSARFYANGYVRDYDRYAPYNYFLDGAEAMKQAPDATLSTDQGMEFGATPPAGGLIANKAEMRWGSSQAGFDYRKKRGVYAVTLNDIPAIAEETGKQQTASNVVIQYVNQEASPFWDKGGGNTPHADLIGKGKAVIMRDGLAWNARWSRPTAQDPTTYTLEDGTAMTFKPGQTWIVLYDKNRDADIKPMTPVSQLLVQTS